MCLILNRSVKEKKPNTEGFCVGWKILRENNQAPFIATYTYKLGTNEPLLPSDNVVSYVKNFPDRIFIGLHLFLTRKDAREDMKNWNVWNS